jgi:hypothetical protein
MNALECLRLSRPPVCDAKEIGPHMRLGAKETWRKGDLAQKVRTARDRGLGPLPFPVPTFQQSLILWCHPTAP